MVIAVDEELEAALTIAALQQGLAPETVALNVLRDRFVTSRIQPRDDLERLIVGAASDCGVSLSNEAVSSEGLYD